MDVRHTWLRLIIAFIAAALVAPAAVALGSTPAHAAPGGPVVMVVGNESAPAAGDVAVRGRLESLGHVVNLVDDSAVEASVADGAALVLVTSSVSSAAVGSTFRDVPEPVWVAKPWVLDDMAMTGPQGNVDYGLVASSSVTILDPGHPLAGGFSGDVAVTATSSTLSFGQPGSSGTVVSSAAGQPSAFVYEAGSTLADGSVSAGCRVHVSIYKSFPESFTADGWSLFDAAAQYATAGCGSVGGDAPPQVDITQPTSGAAVSGSVTIEADATDDVGVSQVAFFADGSPLGIDADGADGWSATWDTTSGPDGSTQLRAVATDTAEQTATDLLDVTVRNEPAPEAVAILISVDGLRPDVVAAKGPAELPNLHRFVAEGASTLNARSMYDSTQTLPNHTSMVTGAPVLGDSGHAVTFNEDNGLTVHDAAGRYVPGIFDVAHDGGMSTGLYAGKPKFDFLDRSWDGANGALDVTGVDDGRDKIDHYEVNSGGSTTSSFINRMTADPLDLSLVHYAEPDSAGHAFGWESPEYEQSLRDVDVWVGQILDLVEADPMLAGRATIALTADHGGTGLAHPDATQALNYTIPLFIWGPGVSTGQDLYAINSATRLDPGTGRPPHDAVPQPIRNADAGNELLESLGLGPVPGSTINPGQELEISESTNLPPAATFDVACAGLTCDLTSTSTDSDGTLVDWAWDFGDDTAASGASVTHEFAANGEYRVSLAVTDDAGATDTADQLVAVTEDLVVFGAFPASGEGQTRQEAVTSFEARIGRTLEVVRVFERWDSPFPTTFHEFLREGGRTPILSVKAQLNDGTPLAWSSIASAPAGSALDLQARSWAQRVRDFDAPIYVTFNHEPEAAASAQSGDPEDFIDAWRRWVEVFREEGADNARFMWIMTDYSYFVSSPDRREAANWYPGDEWLDAMAIDAYNWGSCRPGIFNEWKSLEQIVEPFRQFGLAHATKPLWLAEWGSWEDPESPGLKGRWFDDARALFSRPSHAQFAGVSYFNSGNPTTDCQWFITTSTSAEEAFTGMGDDPLYQADGAWTTTNTGPVASFTVDCTDLTCTFTSTATDADGTIVDWAWDYGDTTTDSGATVSHTYPTAADYTVSLTVTDNDDATHTTDRLVPVTTVDALPEVAITAPASGTTVMGEVALSASATDDVGVVKVEFRVDDTLVGSDGDGSDGWSVVWDSTSVPDGTVTVSAAAEDTAGQSSADSVSVTVGNNDTPPLPVHLVVGNAASPGPGDVAVRDRLLSRGFEVTLIDDGAVAAADAADASFVLVSSSASSAAVGDTFLGAGSPVWVAKPWLLDDMRMTGTVPNTDFGTVRTTASTIVDPSHPLAAGLTGSVELTDSQQRVSFGVPTDAAAVVAATDGLPTTFVYLPGAALADGSNAAGCRIHASVYQATMLDWTADAWALFDASSDFAAEGCS